MSMSKRAAGDLGWNVMGTTTHGVPSHADVGPRSHTVVLEAEGVSERVSVAMMLAAGER